MKGVLASFFLYVCCNVALHQYCNAAMQPDRKNEAVMHAYEHTCFFP